MNVILKKVEEKLAIKFLDLKDFKIIETNYKSPLGEIDIIATNNSILYFIEIKSASSNDHDMSNYDKQLRLGRIATYYMMINREYTEHRFGVIEILYDSNIRQYSVKFMDKVLD